MLYCHANKLHADSSENSTAAVWQQKSVAHLQSDWCRCRADLREQITLPFFQQTKCSCYLNISGLGPSQSALLADHFAAILKMSLSEELDDDDWVTWWRVRSACRLTTGLGNVLQVESRRLKLFVMASDFGSVIPWPVEQKEPHSQVWFDRYTGSRLDYSMRRKEACLEPDKHTQHHSALSPHVAVNLWDAVRYSIGLYLPIWFAEFPKTPLRNQKRARAAKSGLEQKHRMKASHRLAPLTARLPLSFCIHQGKQRCTAGKSFPEVTVVTGKSQSGATVSYSHCN